jgi:hypothetical protein
MSDSWLLGKCQSLEQDDLRRGNDLLVGFSHAVGHRISL